jgi:hypothetical protein
MGRNVEKNILASIDNSPALQYTLNGSPYNNTQRSAMKEAPYGKQNKSCRD